MQNKIFDWKAVKMFNDCCEWAEMNCDEITVGEFFEMIEIQKPSDEYAALLLGLDDLGVFDEN